MQVSPNDDDLGAEFLRFTTIIERELRPWVRDSIVDSYRRCGEEAIRLVLLLFASSPATSRPLFEASRRTIRGCIEICRGGAEALGPVQNASAAEAVSGTYQELRPVFEVVIKAAHDELADDGWEYYDAFAQLMAKIAANCQLCPDQQALARAVIDAQSGAMRAVVDQFAKGQRWAWIRQLTWASFGSGKTFGFLQLLAVGWPTPPPPIQGAA